MSYLVLFGIRKNCLMSGRSLLSYQFTRRMVKLIVIIIGDHQCGFRRNRSTTDQIFYIREILEKQLDYNEAVHQLFVDFKEAYDSVRRKVLYNILIEFGVPMN
jgi:hypothetical protein